MAVCAANCTVDRYNVDRTPEVMEDSQIPVFVENSDFCLPHFRPANIGELSRGSYNIFKRLTLR